MSSREVQRSEEGERWNFGDILRTNRCPKGHISYVQPCVKCHRNLGTGNPRAKKVLSEEERHHNIEWVKAVRKLRDDPDSFGPVIKLEEIINVELNDKLDKEAREFYANPYKRLRRLARCYTPFIGCTGKEEDFVLPGGPLMIHRKPVRFTRAELEAQRAKEMRPTSKEFQALVRGGDARKAKWAREHNEACLEVTAPWCPDSKKLNDKRQGGTF